MDRIIHNAYEILVEHRVSMRERMLKAVRRMFACPFNSSDTPYKLEMDLMFLCKAERESMEIFYVMREELHFYLKRTQLLETILTEDVFPIPDYDG